MTTEEHDHYQQLIADAKKKTAADVRLRLEHELSEMRICLEDGEPNVRMALDRLQNLQRWVAKL